jgi:hypothetical protein
MYLRGMQNDELWPVVDPVTHDPRKTPGEWIE